METQTVDTLRPYLFTIAYRILGEVEEANDMVQDVFAKWYQAEHPTVTNPKAYLARMAVNGSIDRLEELRVERQSYKGTWLPEPLVTEAPAETEPDALDFGMLFLLERLNPRERAVFILRESFDSDYAELSSLTGLSEDNCRQLLHRAKEKLHGPSRQPADTSTHRQLIEAFLFAMQQQDRSLLETILRSDIELYSDGGGKKAAALHPLFGFGKVAQFLIGVGGLTKNEPFVYRPVFIEGRPAALIYHSETQETDSVTCIDVRDGKIAAIYFVRNPDKLRF